MRETLNGGVLSILDLSGRELWACSVTHLTRGGSTYCPQLLESEGERSAKGTNGAANRRRCLKPVGLSFKVAVRTRRRSVRSRCVEDPRYRAA